MAIATDQATTTSYADIVSVASGATPALVEAIGIISGDLGYFQITYKSGRQETIRVTVDGQQVVLPLMGGPNNPAILIQVKGDAGSGLACVNALRYL